MNSDDALAQLEALTNPENALRVEAYHTAIAKGTDVDQPRNLAKSVTVE